MKTKCNLALSLWALCIIAILTAAMVTIIPVGAQEIQPKPRMEYIDIPLLMKECIDKPELMMEYIDKPVLVKEYIDKPELVVEYIDKPVYMALPIWMSYPYIDLREASKLRVTYIHHPVYIDQPIWMSYPYIDKKVHMSYPWIHLPNRTHLHLTEN